MLLVLACGLLAACSQTDPEPARTPVASHELTLRTAHGDPAPAKPEDSATPSQNTTPRPIPPPRRAIAGIAGFQTNSRVVYAAEPGKVHSLSATYLFPDRVRIRLSLEQGKHTDRVLLYRYGEQGFFIDERVANSRELDGDELLDLRLQTELRRALFLWPDGFPWRGDGKERSAVLEGQGLLVAQLGSDGRPTSMKSLDLAAKPVESIQAITWKKTGARQFPGQLELWSDGRRISTEDVLEVETSLNYVDAYFLPPDRRAPAGPDASHPGFASIKAIDMPAMWEFRVELDASLEPTLLSARAAADAARAVWKSRGVAMLDETVLELDRAARPTAVLLRAGSAGTFAPEGWLRRAEGPAWSLALSRTLEADPILISALVAHSSLESKNVRVELHIAPGPGGLEAIQLVVAQH